MSFGPVRKAPVSEVYSSISFLLVLSLHIAAKYLLLPSLRVIYLDLDFYLRALSSMSDHISKSCNNCFSLSNSSSVYCLVIRS